MQSIHRLPLDSSEFNRKTQVRIKIRVPKEYTQEPVITRLSADYHLEVTIIAALLGSNTLNDGWFELHLQGESKSIDSALIYLSELGADIWYQSDYYEDGW